MTALKALQNTVDAAGCLRRVVGYHFEGDESFVAHLVLEFDSGRLVLSAGEEFDEAVREAAAGARDEAARGAAAGERSRTLWWAAFQLSGRGR